MENRIVNIKTKKPYDIYIGRANPSYNLEASCFANPFIIGKLGTRDEVIEKYRLWINCQPELLRKLKTLKGKTLGCWCSPEPCHGEVLIELANAKNQKNWFSNMRPLDKPFEYQGLWFESVETFYQAMKMPKSRLDLRKQISQMNGFKAKTSIRDKDKFPWREDWTKEMAIKVMAYILAVKFARGTNWRRLLDLTEDWEIVEWNNWGDEFWGKDLITEQGENHLGKLLMNIRNDK